MDITKKNPIMVVIGAGGSGPTVFSDMFLNEEILKFILLGVDDCGGYTGEQLKILLRLLHYLEEFGGNERFQDYRKCLPLGDLRNNILRLLALIGGEKRDIAKILDDRIPDSDDLFEKTLKAFQEVFILLGIQDPAFLEQLKNFLHAYFNVYNTYKNEIHSEMCEEAGKLVELERHSLGNIFLMFFFLTSNSNNDFFEKLKDIGLVPDHINFRFISENRHMLLGEDRGGKEVSTELRIDNHKKALLPHKFRLIKLDVHGNPIKATDQKITIYDTLQQDEIDEEQIEIIENADFITFSTGSLANMFTQVNLLAPYLKASKALMAYIANFARTMNEEEAEVAIDTLHSIVKRPFITLLVDKNLARNLLNNPKITDAYMQQDKFFVDVNRVQHYLRVNNAEDPIFAGRILKVLSLVHKNLDYLSHENVGEDNDSVEDFLKRGIRHKSDEIKDILEFFLKIHMWLELQEPDNEMREHRFNIFLERINTEKYHNSEFHEVIKILKQIINNETIVMEERFSLMEEFIERINTEGANITEIIQSYKTENLIEIR